MITKIEAGFVIFDYGNTLVLDPFLQVIDEKIADVQKLLKQNGYNISADDIKKKWIEANKFNYKYASHFSQEEPFIQAMLKNLNIPAGMRAILAPEILSLYRKGFRELLTKDPRKDELRQTLLSLKRKGKVLAVLSNDREFAPRAALEQLGISDLFDYIVTAEEAGIEKPEPKIFEYVLGRAKKSKGESVYVGDDPIRDVEAPKNFGIKAILYIPPKKYMVSESWRDYKAKSKYKPDAVAEKFSDLAKIIE